MKPYSLLLGITIAAVACSSLLAQEKPAIQPNATVLSILQGNAGKTVELHLRSGEKIGGRVGQVTDNVVSFTFDRCGVLRRLCGSEGRLGGGNSRWRKIGVAKWSDNQNQDVLDQFGVVTGDGD